MPTSDEFRISAVDVAMAAKRQRQLFTEAANASLFSKLAAIDACVANPYQPSTVWVPTLFDCYMQIDLRDQISQDIFLYGVTDPDLLWFMSQYLEKGMTFYDCGAHIGFFTLAAGTLVGPDGRVEAFEPTPRTKAHLDTNINNATLTQTRSHALAVWSAEGEVEFHDYGPRFSPYNSFTSARLHHKLPDGGESVRLRVPTTTLDTFAEVNGHLPNMVKLDVESAEWHALQGMKRLLSSCRPDVIVEIGDFPALQLDGAVKSSKELLAWLESFDYALVEIQAATLKRHRINRSDAYGYSNIVAVPRERLSRYLPQ
jgi:FkbM family methyltransferase